MKDFIRQIQTELEKHRDPQRAVYMKAYMKDQYEYLGINAPARRTLTRPFLTKDSRPPVEHLWPVVRQFWELPEREYQYFAMELIARYYNKAEKDWIEHYQELITYKAWWDTVDFIAGTLVGQYFRIYPAEIPKVTRKWMASGNLWLQRSCLLFQLKYKRDTDIVLLSSFISQLAGSREFFIAKAIGWSLREYSKYNPEWVLEFVQKNVLQPLSKREAVRIAGARL